MDKLTIAIAQLNPTCGDVRGNTQKLLGARNEAAAKSADVIVAPESYLSGYQIDDLVLQEGFLERIDTAIDELAKATADGGAAIITGAPRRDGEQIRNSVFAIDGGEVVAIRDKVRLAHGGVFDDNRNFEAAGMPGAVMLRGVLMGLPVCEDMWHADVMECLEESGAEMFVVPNASPFEANKIDERMQEVVARVSETGLPLLYANLVGGVDEMVFDGASFCVNPGGEIGAYLPCFKEDVRIITAKRNAKGGWQFSGSITKPDEGLAAIWQAISLGIRDYVYKNGFERVLLGLSGGIDSALVAVLAVDALGAEAVDAIMLPSPYTSAISLEDAALLAKNLGIRLRQVDIEASMIASEQAITSALKGEMSAIAKENLQSRLRGLKLMSISNTEGQLLLTTGNKSEYAAGYATLYGDMCGGYAPLIDLWKTEVFALSLWRNDHVPQGSRGKNLIPERVITRAPSAELRPEQKDSDSLPDYDILDPIMKGLVEDMLAPKSLIKQGFDAETVRKSAEMLLKSEFKRGQAAPGPKLTKRAFTRDRRMPITNRYRFDEDKK